MKKAGPAVLLFFLLQHDYCFFFFKLPKHQRGNVSLFNGIIVFVKFQGIDEC